jgi:hypothetical protein
MCALRWAARESPWAGQSPQKVGRGRTAESKGKSSADSLLAVPNGLNGPDAQLRKPQTLPEWRRPEWVANGAGSEGGARSEGRSALLWRSAERAPAPGAERPERSGARSTRSAPEHGALRERSSAQRNALPPAERGAKTLQIRSALRGAPRSALRQRSTGSAPGAPRTASVARESYCFVRKIYTKCN